MAKKILARYSNGSLTPIPPRSLDLPEGEMVRLTVESVSQTSEEGEEKSQSAAGTLEDKYAKEVIRRALNSPRLSTNEWLERARKRREASGTRVTAEQILAARDADRT